MEFKACGLHEVTKRLKIRCYYPECSEQVAGGWRRLHRGKLHNLYASSDIIEVIKSIIRWTWHVARMVKMGNTYEILVEKP